jgi:hypothetical protein
MDNSAVPLRSAPPNKRQRRSLFDTSRARNGGSSTSFVTTSNTGIMDTTFGSTTDEEDDDDTEQHYLNKMTDDTDRKVETVFGKGVEVWNSFNGTVYADVNDRIKKQQRDEELWGKKKEKRKRGAGGKQGGTLQQRFDSLRNSRSMSGSGSTSTPGLRDSTYTDGTISYPSLQSSDYTALPHTPTASEWEIFPVRQSQHEDFSGMPLEYKSLNGTKFQQGNAGADNGGSFDRPIKPLPSRAQRSQGQQPTALHPHLPSSQPPSVTPPRLVPVPSTSFFGNMLGGTSRIVSGSFGSFDGSQIDRFDERGYRLLSGQMSEATKKKNENGETGGQRGRKCDRFKGRPWLRRG